MSRPFLAIWNVTVRSLRERNVVDYKLIMIPEGTVGGWDSRLYVTWEIQSQQSDFLLDNLYLFPKRHRFPKKVLAFPGYKKKIVTKCLLHKGYSCRRNSWISAGVISCPTHHMFILLIQMTRVIKNHQNFYSVGTVKIRTAKSLAVKNLYMPMKSDYSKFDSECQKTKQPKQPPWAFEPPGHLK